MEKGISTFIREFEKEKDFILQNSAGRVSNALVRISPVLEGEFVAELESGVNRVPQDTKRPFDPKKRKTRKRLKENFEDARWGDAIWFTNEDEAAGRIEFGYSKKAPQGVFRATARKWRGFIRGVARAATNRARKRVITE